jgi:hypothetical protein
MSSNISVDRDSSLMGAISAVGFGGKQLFLTLRDEDGQVLWSHIVDGFTMNLDEATIRTEPTEEHFDRIAAAHREMLDFKARQRGIL